MILLTIIRKVISEREKGKPILFLIGIIITIISQIFIIIKAFKTSLLWGFGTLFLPIVDLAFIVLYWNETKRYVYWILIGILLFVVGASLLNLS